MAVYTSALKEKLSFPVCFSRKAITFALETHM